LKLRYYCEFTNSSCRDIYYFV